MGDIFTNTGNIMNIVAEISEDASRRVNYQINKQIYLEAVNKVQELFSNGYVDVNESKFISISTEFVKYSKDPVKFLVYIASHLEIFETFNLKNIMMGVDESSLRKQFLDRGSDFLDSKINGIVKTCATVVENELLGKDVSSKLYGQVGRFAITTRVLDYLESNQIKEMPIVFRLDLTSYKFAHIGESIVSPFKNKYR